MAHLQVAAFERFKAGQGFFVTFMGGSDAGPHSVWFSPGIPLQFLYNDTEQVEIEQSEVENMLKWMDLPHGILIHASPDIEDVVNDAPFWLPRS